ncbi:aldehyde dehydrogenase family protein [Flavobacterium circumlabens]|uniref:Acyl-CoA reductase-like NAD-dependent aldehyde dehydrogenase n=1 Tax=Flavobacterium circumlabens TaxID=2133765 RepID=A0A4Y7UHC0_9FLAO|nr:aldehyde dehydrogenase family protein [Flavobacterium circumlabens]TCN60015.1 acyl-CoA reductase-like NAD-dependent aldehyde dehydrogenase [Flavobacterium circumlabens]TEB45252.1 aldehyde dehydrogenase family protein [Flavobacterium circumlabens]
MEKTIKVLFPYDQSIVKELPLINKNDIKNILDIAENLFKEQSNWIPAYKRMEILEKAAFLMKERSEELIHLAISEGGKPYQDTKAEVARAITGVKLAAEHISQIKGEQIPMGLTEASLNRIAFTSKEPIGIVAAVSAFNHPLNLAVHQIATAIAAGCPVVFKPAGNTPLSGLALADILKEAGLPEGWLQVVLCDNETTELLVTDPRVHFLSFIGSAKVGWYLKSKLAPGTRCALEHGGAAPVIVESDADFKEMIPDLVKGGFYHAGQVCVSVQKIYVNQEICDLFTEQFSEATSKLIVGNPFDQTTDVGALITPKEVDRVEEWVNEAVTKGAKIITGGKRISDTCFEPTVLFNPSEDSKVSTHEIFGPVVCIYPFTDRDEAIRKANALDVHFQAAVFTKNLGIALDTVKKLNATAVMVNDHTAFRVDWMPFGGRDASGIGMGGISYSINEMTREKLTVIKSKFL